MPTGDQTSSKSVTAGLLGWLVPGAGHWYLGWRAHGVLFAVVVIGLFWGGMYIGGVRSTVDPNEHMPWFVAQMCAGANPIVALVLGRLLDARESIARVQDMGIVYSGVAGLLNLLVVLDAAARAERPSPEQVPADAAKPEQDNPK